MLGLALAWTACGPSPIPEARECKAYNACLVATGAGDGGFAPATSCWKTNESAAYCAQVCAARLAELKADGGC